MIYFIQANEYIKIGYSKDPQTRLKELQTGNPIKLKLLFTIPGSFEHEKSFHEIFHAQRAKGEWFRFVDKLKWCILAFSDETNPYKVANDIKTFQKAGMYLQILQKCKRHKAKRKSNSKINILVNKFKK